MNYRWKYLKYKHKYLNQKKLILIGAAENSDSAESSKDSTNTPTITQANNHFTIDLFENFDGASNLFSPLSIIYTLSLVHIAANGNTDRQLTKVIGYKHTIDDLKYLNGLFNNAVMSMCTTTVINRKYQINNEYLTLISPLSKIIYEDFENGALISNKINHSIETTTNGMIKNVIQPSIINPSSFLILINTIYFKASWLHKFNVRETTKMKFHKTPEMVDVMHQINDFNYFENSSIQMIELPYDEKDYVMGIILPKKYLEEENLAYSINNVPIISEPQLNEFINNTQLQKIDLYLPKFTHRKRIELPAILKKMGLTNIFDRRLAELDIISKEIYVSNIIHEAVVIVDEIGTEAAATTVVVMEKKLMLTRPVKPILFKADHAFVFYIRYVPSNLILFFGDYQG